MDDTPTHSTHSEYEAAVKAGEGDFYSIDYIPRGVRLTSYTGEAPDLAMPWSGVEAGQEFDDFLAFTRRVGSGPGCVDRDGRRIPHRPVDKAPPTVLMSR